MNTLKFELIIQFIDFVVAKILSGKELIKAEPVEIPHFNYYIQITIHLFIFIQYNKIKWFN